jgi:acetyl esterase/lipase
MITDIEVQSKSDGSAKRPKDTKLLATSIVVSVLLVSVYMFFFLNISATKNEQSGAFGEGDDDTPFPDSSFPTISTMPSPLSGVTSSPSSSPTSSIITTSSSNSPTITSTESPTRRPTGHPTRRPTKSPTESPTGRPTLYPTLNTDSTEEVGCIKTPIESMFDQPQTIHDDIVKEEDVVYGKGAVGNGKKDLELDIYHPDFGNKAKDKYPLMIHIHGGSFTSGSKSDGYIKSLSEHWAHRGFVVASINYRLAGDSPVVSKEMEPVFDYVKIHLSEVLKSEAQAQAATCAVEDTLSAYDYLKKLNYVDADTVIMNGYSAGAITALWATYGVDNFDIERPPVKAVFSHWGMLVVDREETENLVQPTGEPPVFLVHATGDSIVPYDGTQYLANRLQSLGMPYALHCEDSGSHSISIDNTKHSNELSILDAEQIWLRNILK